MAVLGSTNHIKLNLIDLFCSRHGQAECKPQLNCGIHLYFENNKLYVDLPIKERFLTLIYKCVGAQSLIVFSWFGSVTLSVCSYHFIKLTENIVKIHVITVSLYVVQYVHICIHCGAREVSELNWPVHSRFWTVRRLTTLLIFFNFRKTANI